MPTAPPDVGRVPSPASLRGEGTPPTLSGFIQPDTGDPEPGPWDVVTRTTLPTDSGCIAFRRTRSTVLHPIMKKLLAFLALSLAANAAFLVTYLVRPGPSVSATRPAPADGAASTVSPAAAAAKLTAPELAALTRSRELLDGRDLPLLVARLRAAGFSPAQLRAIVSGLVTQQSTARRAEIIQKLGPAPYWSTQLRTAYDRKLMAEFAALNREQDTLVKQVLGPDVRDPAQRLASERGDWSYLPAEKVDRLQEIMRDYSDLRMQLNMENRGLMLAEDRAKLELMSREQRADIERLLTPQELEEYSLRTDSASWMLRGRLGEFNASEEEYRALYKVFKDSGLAAPDPNRTAMSPAERQRAETTLNAQIEAVLGPQRASEYREMSDPNYSQAARLLSRLDLPTSLASQVVSVQQDIQQRANAVRQDRSLSNEDKSSQLAALATEAESRLTSTLGDRGLRAYKETTGYWLNNLTRQPGGRPATQPAVQLPPG